MCKSPCDRFAMYENAKREAKALRQQRDKFVAMATFEFFETFYGHRVA